MNTLIIKKASPSDVLEIKQLLVYVWEITFHSLLSPYTIKKVTSVCYDEALLAAQINDPSITFLVAVDESGKILGAANAREDEDRVVILNRLYVHPSCQKNGVGTKLLNEIVKGFPIAEKILLEVVANNIDSINFYLNYGFQITGLNINTVENVTLHVKVLQKRLKCTERNQV